MQKNLLDAAACVHAFIGKTMADFRRDMAAAVEKGNL